MNYADIETFLELVRTRNLTKAAEHLFLSQSTVSNRLRNQNSDGITLYYNLISNSEVEVTYGPTKYGLYPGVVN
ncbi:MAG: LysR family transcriptional regulator, partial [Oscillospiraceae bacterium]|nr:LysR family transcriptional regulator [Oscillospiraceae bacterium]